MKEKHQCCGQVYNPKGSWGNKNKPCKSNGHTEREGKWYCKIHDPVYQKEKRDKSYQDWVKQENIQERIKSAERNLIQTSITVGLLHAMDCQCILCLALAEFRAAKGEE